MPQPNNYYHYNNYLPHIYLPKIKPKTKPSTSSEVNRKSLHESRTDYGSTRSHRVVNYLANEKVIYEVKPDPSYIYVQDPKMRQVFLMLLKSETQRASNNISPSVLTQIDHQDYSLLFSKTGSVQIDEIVKDSSPQIKLESKLVQTDLNMNEKDIQKSKRENSLKAKSTQTDIYLYNMQNTFYTDSKGNEYYIAEIYDESTLKLSYYPFTMKLPTDVQRLIKTDLDQKTLESGDRSYKVVINKHLTQQGQPPHVVRILVRNAKEYGKKEIEAVKNESASSSRPLQTSSSQSQPILPPINNISTMKYLTKSPTKNDYKVYLIKKEKKKVEFSQN